MAENMRLGEYARELAELKLRRQEIAAVKASLADKKRLWKTICTDTSST